MKRILKQLLVLLLCVLMLWSGCTSVAAKTPDATKLKQLGSEILTASNAEKLLQSVGNSSADWQLLAAAKLEIAPEGTRGAIKQSIKTVWESGGYQKATDAQRAAIAYAAAGGDITDVLGDGGIDLAREWIYDNATCISGGINTIIYGLLALDAGGVSIPASAMHTRESMVRALLALQLAPSGGFALAGTAPDPDMTAMAITALAPYYRQNAAVAKAVEQALLYLSKVQLKNGGFQSYGTEGCESAAQVVIALTALGIDPAADGRFVKSGGDPISAMLGFRVGAGQYSHTVGGKANGIATAQVFCAISAYYRFLKKISPFYASNVAPAAVYKQLVVVEQPKTENTSSVSATVGGGASSGTSKGTNSSVPISATDPVESDAAVTSAPKAPQTSSGAEAAQPTKTNGDENEVSKQNEKGGIGWKEIIAILLAVIAVAMGAVVFALYRRGNRLLKNPCAGLLMAAAALLIAAILLLTVRIQSVEDYYADVSGPNGQVIGQVTVAVECKTLCDSPEVVPKELKEYIPPNGELLPQAEYPIYAGETVFSLLKRVAKQEKLPLEYSETSGAYVEGIGYLYEFACGELSGWIYAVNGEQAEVACSDHQLSDGDVIVWSYTLELGQDID